MNSRFNTLERWFQLLIQNNLNDQSFFKDDVLACSHCKSNLEIVIERAYKVTQEQAQAYHSLIRSQQTVGAEESGQDHNSNDVEVDDEALTAMYSSISDSNNKVPSKHVRSDLERDLLENLENIAIARQTVRIQMNDELQQMREEETNLQRLSETLRETLTHSDIATRELNTLSCMTSGSSSNPECCSPSCSSLSLLFTVECEVFSFPSTDSSTSMRSSGRSTTPLSSANSTHSQQITSINGMRLAYQPIPHLHLNWAEMNLAWTFATTSLCCLRNLHNLPLTVPVAADTSSKTMWTVSLRPLRNRTLIRMFLLQRHDHLATTAADDGGELKPASNHDQKGSGNANARSNSSSPYKILQDMTLNLAGQQQEEQPQQRHITKNNPCILNNHEPSSSFRRAIHALIAYILVTAKDVGKSNDVEILLPASWQRLDWYRCLSEECINVKSSSSSSSSSSSPLQGSSDPDASGTTFPSVSGEELAYFTGNALILLLAAAAAEPTVSMSS